MKKTRIWAATIALITPMFQGCVTSGPTTPVSESELPPIGSGETVEINGRTYYEPLHGIVSAESLEQFSDRSLQYHVIDNIYRSVRADDEGQSRLHREQAQLALEVMREQYEEEEFYWYWLGFDENFFGRLNSRGWPVLDRREWRDAPTSGSRYTVQYRYTMNFDRMAGLGSEYARAVSSDMMEYIEREASRGNVEACYVFYTAYNGTRNPLSYQDQGETWSSMNGQAKEKGSPYALAENGESISIPLPSEIVEGCKKADVEAVEGGLRWSRLHKSAAEQMVDWFENVEQREARYLSVLNEGAERVGLEREAYLERARSAAEKVWQDMSSRGINRFNTSLAAEVHQSHWSPRFRYRQYSDEKILECIATDHPNCANLAFRAQQLAEERQLLNGGVEVTPQVMPLTSVYVATRLLRQRPPRDL